jgi:hypothetical protein
MKLGAGQPRIVIQWRVHLRAIQPRIEQSTRELAVTLLKQARKTYSGRFHSQSAMNADDSPQVAANTVVQSGPAKRRRKTSVPARTRGIRSEPRSGMRLGAQDIH